MKHKKNDLTESLFNKTIRELKVRFYFLNKKLAGLFEKKSWRQIFNKNKPEEGCDKKICFFSNPLLVTQSSNQLIREKQVVL
jgi:hypothetical protein